MTPVIEMTHLGRRFGDVAALSDVNLRVSAGEYLAIIGSSGSGKSTLLNILGCLDRPTSGSYRLDGVETADLGEAGRAAFRSGRVGFVFQAFHLLNHLSIEDNVALSEVYRHRQPGAVRSTRRRRAVEQLERVGLGHRLGYKPSLLSGGERQRVAIARALLGGPALLLCDEPTGNLDRPNTAAVLSLFDELRAAEQMTVLVITHDNEVAERAQRRVRITDGILVEQP